MQWDPRWKKNVWDYMSWKGRTERLTVYFRIEVRLNGEQLISLLFNLTQIRHNVVFTNPRRGAQHVLYHWVVTLYFREGTVHSCGRGNTKSQDNLQLSGLEYPVKIQTYILLCIACCFFEDSLYLREKVNKNTFPWNFLLNPSKTSVLFN